MYKNSLFPSLLTGLLLVVSLSGMTAIADPGIDTPIKKIFVILHSHLDIGYTNPASTVAGEYKEQIDREIERVDKNPGYKWNIEEMWQLRQWMERSKPEEIKHLVQLIKNGRMGVGGGHSSLHATKAGGEELSYFMYDAERFRQKYGVSINTVFHDDTPGLPWTYPQVLSKSGIQYLVVGMNMFIGGGFDTPYRPYLFHWQAPDGSKVLTWATWDSYFATERAGFRWNDSKMDEKALAGVLQDAVSSGYPYDAYMIQTAHDNDTVNGRGPGIYAAINEWNAKHDNPKLVMATPDEFFEYIQSKYGDIPTVKGSWPSIWDYLQMVQPQAEKTAKAVENTVPSAEAMWSIASVLGKGEYPQADFSKAWDMALTINEHTNSGGLGRSASQAEVDQDDKDQQEFVWQAQNMTTQTLSSATNALLGAFASKEQKVAVFNPISWKRTDIVKIALGSEFAGKTLRVVEKTNEGDKEIPCQIDASSSPAQLLFAAALEPFSVKTFKIAEGGATTSKSILKASGNMVENQWYRVQVDKSGVISSIYDKASSREMVDNTAYFKFNEALERTNSEHFGGVTKQTLPRSASRTSVGLNGPVTASLLISSPEYPLSKTEIILYEEVNRIDVVDTADRDRMAKGTIENNSMHYAIAFPFQISNPSVHTETSAGWLDQKKDILPGSTTMWQNLNHCMDIASGDFGITFASPDVYTHEFHEFWSSGSPSPATHSLLLANIIRKCDETPLSDKVTGISHPEPSTDSQWAVRFALYPYSGGFNATRANRAGREYAAPFVAVLLPGVDKESEFSSLEGKPFFSVSSPNVIITEIKQAELGKGLIVRLQETTGSPAEAEFASLLQFSKARRTSPVENDISALPALKAQQKGDYWSIPLSIPPNGWMTLRLLGAQRP